MLSSVSNRINQFSHHQPPLIDVTFNYDKNTIKDSIQKVPLYIKAGIKAYEVGRVRLNILTVENIQLNFY